MRLSEHNLADAIYQEAYEDVTWISGKDWWRRDEKNKERALRNLLINLQVCGDSDDPYKEVAAYRRKEAYAQDSRYRGCHFKNSIYIPLMDALTKSGWCSMQLGWQDSRTGKSFTTRLYPNDEKIFELELKDTFIESPDLIELRDESKNPILPYPSGKYIDRAERQLCKYNAFMEESIVLELVQNSFEEDDSDIITCSGDTGSYEAYTGSDGDSGVSSGGGDIGDRHYRNHLPVTPCNESISPVHFQSRRIFNDCSWKYGGRHYNSIQNYSQEDRKLLLFNSGQTVELDYKAMHPTILYHQLGLTPPQDCYSIFNDSRDMIARECIKVLMLAIINAEDETAAMRAVWNKYNRDKKRSIRKRKFIEPDLWKVIERCGLKNLEDLLEQVKTAHSPLAQAGKFCRPGIGKKLQKIDSEIMRDILHQSTSEDIPAIPIHDSVIVPVSFQARVTEIMQEKYFKKMNGEIVIETK